MRQIIFTLAFLVTLSFTSNAQWVQLTSPSSNSLYCVYFINGTTGYISGSTSGSVIKTTDGGISWIFTNTGTTSTFYDLLFIDALNGFIGGTTKQVLKTTNAGSNWDIKTSGTGTVSSISFPTALIGYAVGGSPATLDKSTDGGNNWTALIPPTSNSIRGVYFVSGLAGWLCGYSGTIWKTTDGCVSWIPETQSSSYNFEKIVFPSATIGYVVGSAGTIMKTTNAGTNWLLQSSGVTANLYDLFFMNITTGWAVGASGKIIKTTDGGSTWLAQNSPSSSATYNAMHMVDANTGYIVGSSGILLKTTNGGGPPVIPVFQKITVGQIVNDLNSSDRCAWGDYDGDGYQDLVVSSYNDNSQSSTYPMLLYHNNGDGTFTRVTTGPIATYVGRTFGVTWGDYDNDGKLDLFVCNGFNENNMLFHNDGGGNFTRIITGVIVNDGGWSECCAWCDYDRDGWLDLFVGNQSNQNNFLYHNNGNGTFTKITSGSIVNDGGWSRGCAWGDYDNDGWPDLFVVNYSGENDFLYHNNGNGTFTRILSGPEVNDGAYGSGCVWGDYDNDGWLDLFVTNNGANNMLYHNDGGTFTRIYTGPGAESGPNCFGTSWFDYDNDGWLDLFVCNWGGNNFLYHNNGNGTFTKITNEIVNLESSVNGAVADYDNNGKLDLFTTKTNGLTVNSLFKNIGVTGNYLICKLHGCAPLPGNSNKAGIGATIQIKAGNYTAYRVVSGGSGMGSQDMLWQHFGLGSRTSLDSVIVFWPSGKIQKFANVPANQVLLADECLVGITTNYEKIPTSFSLFQNYPNPFNPVTKIKFALPHTSYVTIKVYNNLGEEITTLLGTTEPAGTYSVDFNGENLGSGIYFYKIIAGDFTETRKMVLVK